MEEKGKVLHVLGHLRRGGAETLVLTLYRETDRDKIVFDVLTRGVNIPEVAEEIIKQGGRVYEMPRFPRRLWKHYRSMKLFFKEHGTEYRAIHVHANSLLYVLPLKFARKYKIPIRILHSHNTQPANPLYKVLHYVNRLRVGKSVTKRVACSEEAGVWMFGKRPFDRIKNAIEVSRFTYREEVREQLREQYGVRNKFVMGHVGRLERQKNQIFLLDVFCEVKKTVDTVLFMIGEGTLEENLKQYAKEKGIEGSVVFLKNISNVSDYMQMMDVFVLPSLFEGLGISAIEAQAAGLRTVISDRVPQEAVLIPENVRRLPIGAAKEWADVITGWAGDREAVRKSWEQRVAECGYDSVTEAKRLVKLYEIN